jgi:hypothetical protein
MSIIEVERNIHAMHAYHITLDIFDIAGKNIELNYNNKNSKLHK